MNTESELNLSFTPVSIVSNESKDNYNSDQILNLINNNNNNNESLVTTNINHNEDIINKNLKREEEKENKAEEGKDTNHNINIFNNNHNLLETTKNITEYLNATIENEIKTKDLINLNNNNKLTSQEHINYEFNNKNNLILQKDYTQYKEHLNNEQLDKLKQDLEQFNLHHISNNNNNNSNTANRYLDQDTQNQIEFEQQELSKEINNCINQFELDHNKDILYNDTNASKPKNNNINIVKINSIDLLLNNNNSFNTSFDETKNINNYYESNNISESSIGNRIDRINNNKQQEQQDNLYTNKTENRDELDKQKNSLGFDIGLDLKQIELNLKNTNFDDLNTNSAKAKFDLNRFKTKFESFDSSSSVSSDIFLNRNKFISDLASSSNPNQAHNYDFIASSKQFNSPIVQSTTETLLKFKTNSHTRMNPYTTTTTSSTGSNSTTISPKQSTTSLPIKNFENTFEINREILIENEGLARGNKLIENNNNTNTNMNKNIINSDLFSAKNMNTKTSTTNFESDYYSSNNHNLSRNINTTSSFQNTNANTNTSSSDINNNNNNTKNYHFNSAAIFHPTWDEWKRSHLNEKNKINNLNESLSSMKTNSENYYNKQSRLNETQDNRNILNNSDSTEKSTTTRSIIEETYRHKFNNNQQKQEQQQQQQQHLLHKVPNSNSNIGVVTTLNKNLQMRQQQHNHNHYPHSNQRQTQNLFESNEDVYNPPSPIVIHNTESKHHHQQQNMHSSRREQHLHSNSGSKNSSPTKSPRSPRHYPVYPFDKQPQRAASPVHLSSIVLAKEPPIEVETQDIKIEPEPPQVEMPQPKKIKTIMSTQKRKESAPNLTGWRTESDSDTEIQNRLLAKASGSIPIEYISIRRDPKPSEKKPEKHKKSITTGTNTSTERGKRIASTNTNTDELPQYNLHVSLDSLFVKSRREASTSTERRNKNAATETEIRQRDACTVTDIESEKEPTPPPPPPPPQQFVYRSRKSRYTEWETASNPPEPAYRLEFLTKSPRTLFRRNFQSTQQFHQHEKQSCNFVNEDETDLSDIEQHSFCRHRIPSQQSRTFIQEVRADDDDRIVFGSSSSSSYHHESKCVNSNKRSGSFPSLLIRPIPLVTNVCESAASSGATTRRYIKHTHSTNYTPCQPFPTVAAQQQNEFNILPLRLSNGCLNTENWNEQFNLFNSKFSEIFGQQNRQQKIGICEPPKTERYYKFSRTTENKQQVPTFGEIYQRFNACSSSSSAQQFDNQYSQQTRTPIVEMPITPDSTMNRQRFFSSSSSSAGNFNSSKAGYNSFAQQKSCGLGNGAITTTTTTSSTTAPTNIYVCHDNKSSNINNSNSSSSNWFSSMHKGFEPVVRQSSQNYSSSSKQVISSTSNLNNSAQNSQSFSSLQQQNGHPQQQQHVKGHGFNREEEEEELFNLVPNSSMGDSDKQFRPIFHPIVAESSNAFTSTRSTPIAVTNVSSSTSKVGVGASGASTAKRNNFSTSSYEYSENHSNKEPKWPSNGHQQRFYSTQTIAN